MLIEIRGISFLKENKGAELMLHAVVQMVRSKLSRTRLAMAPASKEDYEKRAKLGLLQKIEFQKFGVQWGHMGYLIHPSLRKRYGLVTADEIDVVVDASGFNYSDDWGDKATLEMASSVKRWKKQGKKIILLPQAMGSFSSPQIKEAFRYIALNADLLFARDDVSYKHVTDLTGERPNIKQAPDFTNLLNGIVADGFDAESNRFCIIPNYRMIDKTSKGTSESYLHFLTTCARHLLQQGAKPFFLIHEGANDLWLAKQVVKEVGDGMRIITEDDPLKIKGIIGSCHGVISSRYHGLVSALSQGVPALGTGWSHKYEMLFKEYGFSEGCVSAQSDPEDLRKKIDFLIDSEKSRSLRENLVQVNERLRTRSEKMWQDVFDCIMK